MVPDFGWALNIEADGLTRGSRGDLGHGREEGGVKEQGGISLAPGMPSTGSYHQELGERRGRNLTWSTQRQTALPTP